MPAIKTGSKVPEFSLPTTGGGTWSLKDAAGRKLVIYFYPRDMRKYLGVERSTFLLDGAGRLRQEWRKLKVPGHAEAVLEAARSL